MNHSPPCRKVVAESLPVWVQVIRAAQEIDHRIDTALAEVELSRAKLGVLHQLNESVQPIKLTHLASLLSCVKSNITNLIDRLEADGLVQRIADTHDRRTILVRATQEGKRLYSKGMAVASQAEEKIFKDLKPTERSQLAQMLARLSDDGG